MRSIITITLTIFLLMGCNAPGDTQTLKAARTDFVTKLRKQAPSKDPAPIPPRGLFDLVHYPSAGRNLVAYLTPRPADGKKRPAIIWISGGDCNSIGDFWTPQPIENDQSASAFQKAGVVMFYPSLRGGNDNQGAREGLFGEVNDIIAAYEHVRTLDYVDPSRIYLGGHSTGGTTVLLTSEMGARFRAVFSFGPVANVAGYGPAFLPIAAKKAALANELRLRSPINWLGGIASPTFVFEGENQGNAEEVRRLASASVNPNAHFFIVPRANHFSVLAPATAMIARKILTDTGSATSIAITQTEIDSLMPTRMVPAGQ